MYSTCNTLLIPLLQRPGEVLLDAIKSDVEKTFYAQGVKFLKERGFVSNVIGQVIEKGCTRIPWSLFKKGFSMIVTLQRLRPRVEYFGFSVPPVCCLSTRPYTWWLLWVLREGGGSKYYDPNASPGAGPNRPSLDPLSRRGEIDLKTRGHPGGLLVQEVLRSKVTRVDQTETRNSFGVRFLEEDP